MAREGQFPAWGKDAQRGSVAGILRRQDEDGF